MVVILYLYIPVEFNGNVDIKLKSCRSRLFFSTFFIILVLLFKILKNLIHNNIMYTLISAIIKTKSTFN